MSQEQNSARDMILSAAVQVLQEEGPTKLTQTRVAKAAGLRQGHLTYYFPRKSDLWIATAERAHSDMEAHFDSLLQSSGVNDSAAGQPATEVRPGLVSMCAELVNNHRRTRVLLSLMLQAQEEPELMELCRKNASRSREFLKTVLSTQVPAPQVEVALAALWGLGMRDLVVDMDDADAGTQELVRELFTLLDSSSARS